jgi:hypothetical protein
MFAAQGWASTTYGDTGSALAKDVLAVYIGGMDPGVSLDLY